MINAMSEPTVGGSKRKRGEAQRAAARFIIDYKRENNGNSPTFDKIAAHLGYAFPNCARHIVMGCIFKNEPDHPYMLDLGEGYGRVWLDQDENGRLVVYPYRFEIDEPSHEVADEIEAEIRASLQI